MDVEDVPLRLLNGWRPRVYRLQPGPLRLTRRFLEIAPGLSIQELRLQSGGIRIDGRLEPGTLKIGFIRGKEIRILGTCVSSSIMMVAYGGARLNFAANVPGSALSLHFDPAVAQRIAPESALSALMERQQGPLGPETLLRPVTGAGRVFEQSLRRLLTQAEQGEGAAEPNDIIEASARLIGELLSAKRADPAPCANRRRALALTVENLLWEGPETTGFRRFSLDDAARRLKCSRRSIQLALQEEFGLGFVSLKRSIRLQQVHAILRRDPQGAAGVGRIARAHEFNHLGRFAGHYREMFGVLPSLDLAAGAQAG